MTETKISPIDQKRRFEKTWDADGARYRLKALVRYGDGCGNGHNTLAITGDLLRQERPFENYVFEAGGCLHEEIAARFPELAPHLKYHLCSTDGPMHYPANPLYLASNKDCWGRRKGEPIAYQAAILFSDNPIKHTFGAPPEKFVEYLEQCNNYDFEILEYHHEDRKTFGAKYTFGGYAEKWHECPFETEDEAERFLHALKYCDPQFIKVAASYSDGKEPELNAARSSAIWPDATLEQLQDEAALVNRLPALMAGFREAVESYGFVY